MSDDEVIEDEMVDLGDDLDFADDGLDIGDDDDLIAEDGDAEPSLNEIE